MSPNDIEVLLHCHCSPEPHERLHAPAVKDTIAWFVNEGIILPHVSQPDRWQTTKRGEKLVEMLCATPLPEFRWVDPREKP